MPLAAVTAATCLSAGFASIMMGIVARYPIALAPGMGLNAYFAYIVCIKMNIPWQTALGAVFLSGVIFLALTAVGIRQMILHAIPHELYAAVASGHRPLHIALIGFRNASLVVGDASTIVGLGNLRNPHRGAGPGRPAFDGGPRSQKSSRRNPHRRPLHLHGIAWAMGLTHWTPAPGGLQSLAATAFQLDIRGALNKGLLEIVFIFFFVDLFDNLRHARRRHQARRTDRGRSPPFPGSSRILFTDATATVFGSLTGTSTVTSYVESTAGVAAGRPLGRHRHRHRPALSGRHW